LTTGTMCVIMLHMKTASVRDIQHHFCKVLALVEKGEEVLVTRRNKTVARLVPFSPADPVCGPMPDFAARARAIWGMQSRKAPGAPLSQSILAEREERK